MTSTQYRLLRSLSPTEARDAEELSRWLGISYRSTVVCLMTCKRHGWVARGEAIESYKLTEAGVAACEEKRKQRGQPPYIPQSLPHPAYPRVYTSRLEMSMANEGSCAHEWGAMLGAFLLGCPHGFSSPAGCCCDCDAQTAARHGVYWKRVCRRCYAEELFVFNNGAWWQGVKPS